MASKLGQRVLFRLPDFPPGVKRYRPADVVQDFGGCQNLKVHLDEASDLEKDRPINVEKGMATSSKEGKDVGEWRPLYHVDLLDAEDEPKAPQKKATPATEGATAPAK